MTTISIVQTLQDHLKFPLIDTQGRSRPDAPIIDVTHPFYDYYIIANWSTVAVPTEAPEPKEVVIVTRTDNGLFKTVDKGVLTTAINDTGFTLAIQDSTEACTKTLENFVKDMSVRLVRTNANLAAFEFINADDPGIYAVYPTDQAMTQANRVKFHRETQAYLRISKKFPVTQEADAIFNGMRYYYAFKRIDDIFGPHVDDYFLLQRLVTLTKLVFVARLMFLAESNKVTSILNWIMEDCRDYQRVDTKENILVDETGKAVMKRPEKYALDDMFRQNVQLSHTVKANSEMLVDTKTRVASARDNLQSLSNTDGLVKTHRRNSLIVYWVVVALLVTQILSLVAAEYFKSPVIGYVVIVTSAIVVLFIEARDGLNALINI